MKAVLVNYEFTPTWLLASDLDYHIFDRSSSREYLKDFPQDRIIYKENIGNVDYDKLSYLVENYDNLPDVFLWGKTNLFKYISEEEWQKVANNKDFTPVLTQHHKTYEGVCYYEDGIYHERIDLNLFNRGNIKSQRDFMAMFNLPAPDFIPFAPGGNYILTRETVHRYPKEFYEKMRDVLPYTRLPDEAQFAERSYYLLWK